MNESGGSGHLNPDYERCQQVLSRHEAHLLAHPDVIGVGVGHSDSGEYGLVLLLQQESAEETRADLPSELEGVPVWPRTIGSIEAQEGGTPGE